MNALARTSTTAKSAFPTSKVCFPAAQSSLNVLEKLEEAEEAVKGKEEVIRLLQVDSKMPMEKLTGWTHRFTELRLENRTLNRKNQELAAEKAAAVSMHEAVKKELAKVEEANSRIQEEFESAQIEWESREFDLEQMLHRYEEERE